MISEYILRLLDTLKTFGAVFGTFLFHTLRENLYVLERAFDWFDVPGFLVILDVLDPQLGEWLLDTPIIVIVLGVGLILYAVYTIVKYILDIVL